MVKLWKIEAVLVGYALAETEEEALQLGREVVVFEECSAERVTAAEVQEGDTPAQVWEDGLNHVYPVPEPVLTPGGYKRPGAVTLRRAWPGGWPSSEGS